MTSSQGHQDLALLLRQLLPHFAHLQHQRAHLERVRDHAHVDVVVAVAAGRAELHVEGGLAGEGGHEGERGGGHGDGGVGGVAVGVGQGDVVDAQAEAVKRIKLQCVPFLCKVA